MFKELFFKIIFFGLRQKIFCNKDSVVIFRWLCDYTYSRGFVLSQKFGGKYVLGLGVTISAVLSMLIPLNFLWIMRDKRMLAAAYAKCNHLFAVIFDTLSICLDAFLPYGLYSNSMDLNPNYSGTIMSIGNACGAFSTIMAPYTIGLLTP